MTSHFLDWFTFLFSVWYILKRVIHIDVFGEA